MGFQFGAVRAANSFILARRGNCVLRFCDGRLEVGTPPSVPSAAFSRRRDCAPRSWKEPLEFAAFSPLEEDSGQRFSESSGFGKTPRVRRQSERRGFGGCRLQFGAVQAAASPAIARRGRFVRRVCGESRLLLQIFSLESGFRHLKGVLARCGQNGERSAAIAYWRSAPRPW